MGALSLTVQVGHPPISPWNAGSSWDQERMLPALFGVEACQMGVLGGRKERGGEARQLERGAGSCSQLLAAHQS